MNKPTVHGPPSTPSTYDQALAFLGAGRLDEGIALLESLVEAMPKALGDLAYAHYSRGHPRKALEYLHQYVGHFPDEPGAWALMAQAARALNDLANARLWAETAVALDPRNAERWFDLGLILFFLNDWKPARRAFRRCLRLDPAFHRARVYGTLAHRALWLERIRAITWTPPLSWLLRWLLARRFVADLVERSSGVRLDDPRWRTPLAWGALDPAPAGQEPESFARHFANCDCPFWRWFRAQRLESETRDVLEVGIAAGHVAEHFARQGFDVHSVTPSERARLDRERRGLAAVRGDLHFIPERGSSFDLVVAPFALQHSRAPLFALFEWKRLLRPDGCLFLMAHLAVDRPASDAELRPREEAPLPQSCERFDLVRHLAHGVPGQIVALTYWQLRWLFKHAGLQLLAETLEDPATSTLHGTEPVDGRQPPEPLKAWNAYFLLRKPGRLPFDDSLEKPRPIAVP
jgi:SAM-dependent methyltransferase